MNKTHRTKVQSIFDLIAHIRKEVGHEDLSLNQLQVLAYIALRDSYEEPADSRQIAEAVGLSTSGVSRAVASLGDYGRGGAKGLGLLEFQTDPNDRRRKPVVLSRKGMKVMEKITQALN